MMVTYKDGISLLEFAKQVKYDSEENNNNPSPSESDDIKAILS